MERRERVFGTGSAGREHTALGAAETSILLWQLRTRAYSSGSAFCSGGAGCLKALLLQRQTQRRCFGGEERNQSIQSTITPIARKGLLRSSDTLTGRSSPRRVEFSLSDGNTGDVEVQEKPEDLPEMEESADTSHLEYDDSPENDHKSSDPADYCQSTGQCSEEANWCSSRGYFFLRRVCRCGTGSTTGCEGNTERRSWESSAHFRTQTKCIPESAHRIPENAHHIPGSVDFGTQPGSISESIPESQRAFPASQRAFPASQRAFPESQRAPPIPSQSMPSSVPVYSRDIDYSSSIRHIDLSSMRSTYAVPGFLEAQQRVYDIVHLPSSIREEENAPIAESERSLLPSSRSANVLSMQAQRIEKECSTLIGDHTLLHEPFPPAARLSVLVVSMWAAASRRVGCTVDLDEVVIKQRREKKGITIEVVPEDGFSEDVEALAADLAAFRNAQRAPLSTPGGLSGSDNGGGLDEVVHAQLRGIEAEDESEGDEEE
ncbi:hypothetical protein DFP73DRAFT_596298 [Morchella snyderi]|nr:hypothetical protein DFP73DRAFT_596298 [Morchella snyderi]